MTFQSPEQTFNFETSLKIFKQKIHSVMLKLEYLSGSDEQDNEFFTDSQVLLSITGT